MHDSRPLSTNLDDPTITATTTRFGEIEVRRDDVFELPAGIPGFPRLRRVALLAAGAVPGRPARPAGAAHSVYWMQDLDDGSLAFMCVVPFDVVPDYSFDLDDEPGWSVTLDHIRVLTLVSIRRDGTAARLTTNLRAPLVVDLDRRTIRQIVLADPTWPVRAEFAELVTTGAR